MLYNTIQPFAIYIVISVFPSQVLPILPNYNFRHYYLKRQTFYLRTANVKISFNKVFIYNISKIIIVIWSSDYIFKIRMTHLLTPYISIRTRLFHYLYFKIYCASKTRISLVPYFLSEQSLHFFYFQNLARDSHIISNLGFLVSLRLNLDTQHLLVHSILHIEFLLYATVLFMV